MHIIEKFNAGEFRHGYNYKYFLPSLINTEWSWSDATLNKLLEQASFELGQLNSFALLVPNIDLFMFLHVKKEAVVSSKIEGTKTHFDEAFLHNENIEPEKKDDWQEVQNYADALNSAIKKLKNIPLSTRLILKTHKLLMNGVRGETKNPGEYRKSQNWLGGHSLADAVFIPPHHEHLNELLGDLENFIHNENLNLPTLIKAAILHYQFETIHPFLDGNGRIGRLMIILFLINQQTLAQPLLYLSSYFEKDRQLYYDNLTRVRTRNDMLQWIKYFLVGIAQVSSLASNTLKKILELKSSHENIITVNFGRRIKTALLLHNYLLQQPLISVKDVCNNCDLSPKAAGELINTFVSNNILKEYTGKFRNRIFIYKDYLNLFND